jgi:signal peptidase
VSLVDPRRAVRVALACCGWALGAVALALVLVLAAPLAFGQRPLQVLSGSMEPTLDVGDIAVVGRIEPAQARVGDIVTFRNPEGRLITHRVRAIRPAGRSLAFVTRGDANNASEHWTIARSGQLSRLTYRVPHAGTLVRAANSPPGRLLLVTLPMLLLGAMELRRIWRQPDTPSEEARL